jgi:hypothetical protein
VIPGRSAAVAAAVAVATAGCGLGPGEASPGEASLVVTHDYGAEPVLEATESDPAASETVIRFLDREAEISTRYGGGFVQSINGTSGELAGGRSSDWFFFVNGIESPRGGADVSVRGGDRIWWDYRDWTDAMRAPAVVGSWPEPFLQASTAADERAPVVVDCLGAGEPCDRVGERLEAEGVEVGEPGDDGSPRILVGPWARLRGDPVAASLEDDPAASGVFARFEAGAGGWDLVALDERAAEAGRFAEGAGLVAALRRGEEAATWVVTGTDPAGVEAAAGLLDAGDLEQRYAVAVSDGSALALPDQEAE